MSRLAVGSVVIIDAGEAFIVMKCLNGFTIAQVDETGVELKDQVVFTSLQEMEDWFEECESKIARVIPFCDYLYNLHRLAENELNKRDASSIDEDL
jgi:hypothetical protein